MVPVEVGVSIRKGRGAFSGGQPSRQRAPPRPDPRLEAFIAELEDYLPPAALGPEHLGFAVPLRLQSEEGELALITTLTSFATATDVTLAELQLEAFLPADEVTAHILRQRLLERTAAGSSSADATSGATPASLIPPVTFVSSAPPRAARP